MSTMLIHLVISLFFFNFVSSMDDEFGQSHGNERQSFEGFGNYSGTQYAGFGYPYHNDDQDPPTPRFSNFVESVGSCGTGYESNASVSCIFLIFKQGDPFQITKRVHGLSERGNKGCEISQKEGKSPLKVVKGHLGFKDKMP
ncbi:unnamed protein product [Meloidogyne enterolobii]|uniref:Uncharacterized protein n=1 Tax=Meloidogyne enterolobii TaxID=390850 RepID=A0ACB1B6W6_MELEN